MGFRQNRGDLLIEWSSVSNKERRGTGHTGLVNCYRNSHRSFADKEEARNLKGQSGDLGKYKRFGSITPNSVK